MTYLKLVNKPIKQTTIMTTTNYYSLLGLLAPLAYGVYGLCSHFLEKSKIASYKSLGSPIAFISIVVALAGALMTYSFGAMTSPLLGMVGVGFSLKLDALSVLMFVMISLLGFIIVKFSQNYLDGDPRQKVFIARLAYTIASVQLLVLSGNLGQLMFTWVLTSLALHQLLVFYRGRPGAIIAARKKFIVARLGDVFLLGAIVLIYIAFGTGDLGTIFSEVKTVFASEYSLHLEIATVCIALAAILKSGQFPTHGWLIEVVETPTPVSALLHAGLLNAGPFLIVRMAFMMNEATYAPAFLIVFGGFTALFASVVFLTQPSVKVALGYSSVAHMGFMLLICGFGVYTAAMLHLVAHSFYKAHAFLSSGSVIDVVRANKVTLPARLGSVFRIVGSILFALAIYFVMAMVWNIDPVHEFSLLATGAIVVMGLSQILVPMLDTHSGFKGVLKASGLTVLVALSFFTLEEVFNVLLQNQIPIIAQPSTLVVVLTSVTLAVFAAAVLLQLLAPVLDKNDTTYRWGVHFKNGFYANARFDRMVGSLKNDHFTPVHLEIVEEDSADQYLRMPAKEEQQIKLQAVIADLK